MKCGYCFSEMGTAGCANHTCPSHQPQTIDLSQQPSPTFITPEQQQLDRIEAKLDKLLARKKRKPRASKVEYPEWFETLWKAYPKRAGSNPKDKAYKAINARYRDNLFTDDIALEEGTRRYAAFCDATNKTGTELVMQACRFYGPGKEYENDWTIPKQPKDPAEINSPIHDAVDFEQLKAAEKRLDPVDPYADMKEQNDD